MRVWRIDELEIPSMHDFCYILLCHEVQQFGRIVSILSKGEQRGKRLVENVFNLRGP